MVAEGDSAFLSDVPIESEEEDEFHHVEYVDALMEILGDAAPPWNVGVFGRWGTGKSSIVNLLFQRVEDHPDFEDTVCVEFDAWKHAEGSIRTELLLALDREFGRQQNEAAGLIGEEAITNVLYDVEEEEAVTKPDTVREQVRRFGRQHPGLVAAFALLAATAAVLQLLGRPRLASVATTALLLPVLGYMIKEFDTVTRTLQRKFLYPRKEWSGAYEQLFDEVIEAVDADRIIISIDNLDRCESESVYQVLVALKTFMGHDRCIYLIPCDDKALQRHIRSYVDESGTEREFLRKFFHAHIRIPPFMPEDIDAYARSLNQQVAVPYDEEVLDVITKAYVRNPRSIKQGLNRLSTLRIVAKEIEGSDDALARPGTITSNLPFLAKIAILQEDFPKFYDALTANPRLLEEMNEYFAGRITEQAREERLETLLDDEDGLEDFLWATRRVTEDNIRPFLHLSEPSYTTLIAKPDEFVQNLRKGQRAEIREEMEEVVAQEKAFDPYYDAIAATLEEARPVESALFTVIEGLMYVFDLMDDTAQARIARLVSNYLVTHKDFLRDVDPADAMPMIAAMPYDDRADLLEAYASVLVDGDELNATLLEAFVAHAEAVPQAVVPAVSDRLVALAAEDEQEFLAALDLLEAEEPARAKFATSAVLQEAIALIEASSNERDFERLEYYTRFDPYAAPDDRGALLDRLLAVRDDVEENNQDQLTRTLAEQLLALEPRLTEVAGQRLYRAFDGTVKSPRKKDWVLLEVLFAYYESFPAETQAAFKERCVNLLQDWDATSRQVLDWAEAYDVPIIEADDDVAAVLDQIPDNLSAADTITATVLPAIPREFEEMLLDRVGEIVNMKDREKARVGAAMFAAEPERFASVQDEVVARCLRMVQRSSDLDVKRPCLEALITVFEDLDGGEQEQVLSNLSALARGSNKENKVFDRLWGQVKPETSETHRQKIARDLLDELDAELRDIDRPPSATLVTAASELTDVVQDNELEGVLERLSNKLTEGSLKTKQRVTILEQLAEFDEFAGHEETVLHRVDACLEQYSHSRIRRAAEGVLDQLDEYGEIDDDQLQQIREDQLEA